MKPAVIVRVIAVLAMLSGVAWATEAPVGLSNPDVKAPERVGPAAIAPVQSLTGITAEEMRRLGIVNVADALKQLVPQNVATYVPVVIPADSAGTMNTLDRGGFFIGNTIANLRGLDPAILGRPLTGNTLLSGAHLSNKPISLPPDWTGMPLSERRSCPAASSTCSGMADLLASRPDGSTRLIATAVSGTLIALPRSQLVFACADSADAGDHDGPSVIDLGGTRTWLAPHPSPVRACEKTGSGSEVLLTYSIEQNGRHYTLARVFDANGTLLRESTFSKEGALKFRSAGRKYSAAIPVPGP